jgi:alpha-1,3-rhamnosyl/mannosyltransferase
MGQQHYESEIQRALHASAGSEWDFDPILIAPARTHPPGTKRMSVQLSETAPVSVSRALGRVLYGNPDLVHRFDLRLPSAWGREVVTIHDLPPLRFPDEGRLTRSAAAGARRAARVIAPSAFAAMELGDLLGIADVVVIPHGLSAHCSSPAATEVELSAKGIAGPFLLHAAGATMRKNLVGLADAWRIVAGLHPDLTLVLCGAADPRRDRAFAGADRIVKTGRLGQAEIAGLMRRATAVIVPSIYEGFGLPALEGMACGVPVVAANRGALPEVCGDAALLVEPDGPAIAEAIERVLTDEPFAAKLRIRGPRRAATFDWGRAARAHLRVYEAALQ